MNLEIRDIIMHDMCIGIHDAVMRLILTAKRCEVLRQCLKGNKLKTNIKRCENVIYIYWCVKSLTWTNMNSTFDIY